MMVSMRIAQGVFTSVVANPADWRANWAWGLPLIVLTVLIHVLGLGLMMQTHYCPVNLQGAGCKV